MLEAPPPPPHVQVHAPDMSALTMPQPPRVQLPIQEEDDDDSDERDTVSAILEASVGMVPLNGHHNNNNNARKGSTGQGSGDYGEGLPWNIALEKPPNPMKTELYNMEGSWRLICNQVRRS